MGRIYENDEDLRQKSMFLQYVTDLHSTYIFSTSRLPAGGNMTTPVFVIRYVYVKAIYLWLKCFWEKFEINGFKEDVVTFLGAYCEFACTLLGSLKRSCFYGE